MEQTEEGKRIDRALRAALGQKVTISPAPDATATAFGKWVRRAAGLEPEPEGKHGSE